MFGRRKEKTIAVPEKKPYDPARQEPVLKCSICNGEQVAGFQDKETGRFQEAGLIRNDEELQIFLRECGVSSIRKIY